MVSRVPIAPSCPSARSRRHPRPSTTTSRRCLSWTGRLSPGPWLCGLPPPGPGPGPGASARGVPPSLPSSSGLCPGVFGPRPLEGYEARGHARARCLPFEPSMPPVRLSAFRLLPRRKLTTGFRRRRVPSPMGPLQYRVSEETGRDGAPSTSVSATEPEAAARRAVDRRPPQCRQGRTGYRDGTAGRWRWPSRAGRGSHPMTPKPWP